MLNEVFDKEAFEKSKQEIKELCNRFDANIDQYMRTDYKEEDVKVEFISPMFKALGWDVDNESNNSTQFQDVPAKAFYARAVAWAVENKITNGTDPTHFSPEATCTRGQVVTFLYRTMTGK